jgi:hypothetical protein
MVRREATVTHSNFWKRNSFLKRHPALSRDQFSRHYEQHHGPLAASQAGFRKHTLRYVQNEVEGDAQREATFDGITMTTQVPREDYSRGFFHEADYDNVKPDELYLFDMSRTVSVLGEVIEGPATPQPGFKLVVLSGEAWKPAAGVSIEGASSLAVSRLDIAHASALGFKAAAFAHPFMLEIWFGSQQARAEAVARSEAEFGRGSIALPVRERLIFGPERPWPERGAA